MEAEHFECEADVVDGFERKSFELLEYVNCLEAKLEQQKSDCRQKECQLSDALKHKYELEILNARLHQDHDKTIQCLLSSETSLKQERKRAQELERTVDALKQQLEQKEQLYGYTKAREERDKRKLEEQLKVLRKKVTLGWILGCLSEVYLRLDRDEDDDVERPEDAKNDDNELDFSTIFQDQRLDRGVGCNVESPKLPAPGDTTATTTSENCDSKQSDSDSISESGNDNTTAGKLGERILQEHPQNRGKKIQEEHENVCPSGLVHEKRAEVDSGNTDDTEFENNITQSTQPDNIMPVKSQTPINPQQARPENNRTHSHENSCSRHMFPRPQTPAPSTHGRTRPKTPCCRTDNILSPPKSPNQIISNADGTGSSPRESNNMSRAEMFRRQRDIHKLISNMESSLNSLIDAEKKKRTA